MNIIIMLSLALRYEVNNIEIRRIPILHQVTPVDPRLWDDTPPEAGWLEYNERVQEI